MSPPQSLLLAHGRPASPASATGAHWHVSHPLVSLRMPFGQLGKQPSPGQASVGHERICQPHVPSAVAEHTGPPMDPSEQTTFGAPGAGPEQSLGIHPDPASVVVPEPPVEVPPPQPLPAAPATKGRVRSSQAPLANRTPDLCDFTTISHLPSMRHAATGRSFAVYGQAESYQPRGVGLG